MTVLVWLHFLIITILQTHGQKVTPLQVYGISLKIKKRGTHTHIMCGLEKPCFIESLNYSQTGTENMALPFPLFGKYTSSQKRELKLKDKWTPSCQEKPAASCPCLLGPALPSQLLWLPEQETSTRAWLLANGGVRSWFPHPCSTLPERGVIGTCVESHARSFCIRCLLSLKIKRSYW